MKKLKFFIAVGAVLCALFIGVACSSKELTAPTDFSIDDNNVLTWTVIEDARNYLLEIVNAETEERIEKKSKHASYELSLLSEGDYEIRVKAVGGGDVSKDSDWSSIIYFHKAYETGCIYTLINNDTEFAITKAGTASGDIVIEDIYRGKPVTQIAEKAFKGKSKIENVVIGNNVTSVGENAFYNCSRLNSVTFPDSLKTLGSAAFQGCRNLKTVSIPDSLTVIKESTFALCRSLESIDLGNGVKLLEDSAFSDCSSIIELEISDSVETIGTYAFSACFSMEKLTLGNSVKTIDSYAFFNCTALKTIVFSEEENLESIGEYSFGHSNALEYVAFPEGLTTIEKYAFVACKSLASVDLPNSLIHLGTSAFSSTKIYEDAIEADATYVYADDWVVSCQKKSSLTHIKTDTLKENVVGIADGVFSNATELLTVTLPQSVKYIGNASFAYCEKLWKFQSYDNSLVKIDDYAFYKCSVLYQVLLGKGLNRIGAYAFYGCEDLENNATYSLVPDSVRSIGQYAFKGTALWDEPDSSGVVYAGNWVVGFNGMNTGTITLSKETVGVADYAFYQCDILQSVIGLAYAKYIGEGAFYECANLATVSLNSSLTSISDYTFYKCSSLFRVEMPARLRTIGRSAFYKCEQLSEIDFSNSLVSDIGDYAFYGCGNVKEVNLGEDLQAIGDYAFYKCNLITEIVIPDTVTVIGERAYASCEALSELTLGENIVTIGNYAFYKTALKNIEIPNSVITIGNYAFYNCKQVTSLSLGNSVQTIGNYAFCGLSEIYHLELPSSITSIGDYAFKGYKNLQSIVLHGDIRKIGEHAFYGAKMATIYTETTALGAEWHERWNSSYRPIVWGCTLSPDKTFVFSVTVTETTFENAYEANSLAAPERKGFTFKGWALEAGSTEVKYSASDVINAQIGETLYAVWEQETAI